MPGMRFGARTLARSQALQLLFQAEATGRLVADVLAGDYVLDFEALVGDDEQDAAAWPLDTYAAELALGADGMLHELDRAIDDAALNWTVGRMPSVDRNLLRLAIYEMACTEGVATSVSINEFVELAKAYGTDESSRFVNGVLGRVAKRMDAGEDVLGTGSDAAGDARPAEDEDATASEGEVADVAAPEEPAGDTDARADAAAGDSHVDVNESAPAASTDEADSAVSESDVDVPVAETMVDSAEANAEVDSSDADNASADADAAGTAVANAGADDDAKDSDGDVTVSDDDLPEWARG